MTADARAPWCYVLGSEECGAAKKSNVTQSMYWRLCNMSTASIPSEQVVEKAKTEWKHAFAQNQKDDLAAKRKQDMYNRVSNLSKTMNNDSREDEKESNASAREEKETLKKAADSQQQQSKEDLKKAKERAKKSAQDEAAAAAKVEELLNNRSKSESLLKNDRSKSKTPPDNSTTGNKSNTSVKAKREVTTTTKKPEVPAPPEEVKPSLYCFALMMPFGYEPELLLAQMDQRLDRDALMQCHRRTLRETLAPEIPEEVLAQTCEELKEITAVLKKMREERERERRAKLVEEIWEASERGDFSDMHRLRIQYQEIISQINEATTKLTDTIKVGGWFLNNGKTNHLLDLKGRGSYARARRDLFDEDYDQRDQALRKLVLKNSQEIRDLMHQTGDFWLAPATSKPFAAGLGAGKEYGKAVRAAGKKHGLGSSHVHKSSKQVIREFVEATNHTKGNILVEEMILAFKVQETYKREGLDAGDRLGKISFALNPTPCLQAKPANHEVGEQAMEAVKVYEVMKLKTAITIGLQSINGKKATGPGPKTALERSVESTLRRR
ncbi:unnamed protein product [Prorocentrum cordatum]|uniref:Uncharacterized protein n=1 Tax=Prorocentrum cordatum TaxID=2364126 RepID=A0ABN9U4Y4_9DINO|nr:unnamed protein product [Polarella glacialis]